MYHYLKKSINQGAKMRAVRKKTSRSKSTTKKAATKKKSTSKARSTAKKIMSKAKPSTKKKSTAKPKRVAKKPAAKKKATAKPKRAAKKTTPRKAVKKAAAKKKTAPKKTAKKKAVKKVAFKKKVVKKKAAPRKAVKKAAVKKKAAPKRTAKKAVARKKSAVKKKAAPRKAVKKKIVAKPRVAAKKKVAASKPKLTVAAPKYSFIKTIDKYGVISVIGQGGMGKVYKAVHPVSKKFVIIKQLMLAKNEILIKRFKREADIMSSLNHNNIVTVYDFLKIGSSCYFTMEFVDGLSLEDLIKKKGKIDEIPALLIFNEACKGLKHAHDKEIIHRDIKPDNVLISKNGEVKLVDFGIARDDSDPGEGLTKTGVVMGTPAYMSPEQLISAKYVDKRTDIYSMGVMFYQMITGKKPFSGAFTAENIQKISTGNFTNPKQYNPKISGLCIKIIKKAMHHKKDKRPDDLSEVMAIMTKHIGKFKTQSQINSKIRSFLR
jgi:tRNA A-37 threonylcarbamoyl transferase component Bud32